MKKKISIIMALALVIELIGCLGANKTDINAETTNVITQNWQNYSDVWETGQEYITQNKFSSTNTNIKADIVSTGFAANYDTNVPDDAYSIGGMWGDNPYQIRSTNTVKVVPGNTYKFKFAIKNGMKKSKTEATEKNITVAVNSNIKGDSTTFLMKTITVPAGVSKQYEFDVPISQDYGSNSVQLQFAYGSYLYSYSLTEAVKNGKVSDSVGMNNKYACAYGTTENASASGTLEFSDIAFQGEKYSEIYTTAHEKDEGDYWKSFSVCTREDGGKWEDALKELSLKKGIDYATEGYVTKGSTNDSFEYYVVNSGWDAEYSPIDNSLKDDNPWGMTASKNDISVENGRKYTISFKIKSTLKRNDTKNITSKHIRFRMYNPNDESEEIYAESIEGISNGFILLDSNSNQYSSIGADGDGYVTVVIKIHIPLEDYNSDAIAFKFGFGANLLSYPDEIAQKGSIFVKDFKVVPGEMETTERITTEETTTEETSPEITEQITTKETTTEETTPEETIIETTSEGTENKELNIVELSANAYREENNIQIDISYKISGEADGYQIKISNDKYFSDDADYKKMIASKDNKVTFVLNQSLDEDYVYVKVRAYRLSNGVRNYGNWSEEISVYLPEIDEEPGDVEWSIDEKGTLYWSGGNVNEDGYSLEDEIPWYEQKDKIKNVIIGEGVDYISNYTFMYCENLETITIPANVKSIGSFTFFGCDNLKYINIEENNSNYISMDGVLFNKNKTEIVIYPNAKEGKYEIPKTVTVIGENAFRECYKLSDLVIPDSVTTIKAYAFFDCTNLLNVTIPRSVKKMDSCGLGLLFSKNGKGNKIKGFKMKGYIGTVAETYARDEGLTFEDITNVVKNPEKTTPVEKKPNNLTKKKNATIKIKKITKSKKSIKITWEKVKGVKGYQIQYSTSSKFKKAKKITIKNAKITSKKIRKLKAKKKYYVRIRAIRNKQNGKWSNVKKITC